MLLEKEAFCWKANRTALEVFRKRLFKGQELWSLIYLNPSLHKSPHSRMYPLKLCRGSPPEHINVAPRMLEDREAGVKVFPLPVLLPSSSRESHSALRLSGWACADRSTHGSLHKSTDFWVSHLIPFDFGARTTPLSWKYCGHMCAHHTCANGHAFGHTAWFIILSLCAFCC